MKKALLLVLGLLPGLMMAQMRQMNWVLSASWDDTDMSNPSLSKVFLRFIGTTEVEVYGKPTGDLWWPYEALSIISDNSGELLLYSDNKNVYYRNGEIVFEQAGNIHPSSITNGCLFLPLIDNKYIYVNLHYGHDVSDNRHVSSYLLIEADDVEAPTVSAEFNLWQFPVAEKLAAVRHGNGRDWWVVGRGVNENNDRLFISLLTPEGLDTTYSVVTSFRTESMPGIGEMVFSPSGEYLAVVDYAQLEPWRQSGIFLLGFDRCSGAIWIIDSVVSSEDHFYSVEFSPNGKILYASTINTMRLFQIRISQSGLQHELIYQGSTRFGRGFGQLQLAPNGKIYLGIYDWHPGIVSSGSLLNSYLSAIEYPNIESLGCDFNVQSIYLNGFYMRYGSLPNFANYDLGPWEGSPCDTLPRPVSSGLAETVDHSAGSLFPNPSSGALYVTLPWQAEQIVIYDIQGRNVLSRYPGAAKEVVINLGALPEGLYILHAISPTGAQWSERFVYQKR